MVQQESTKPSIGSAKTASYVAIREEKEEPVRPPPPTCTPRPPQEQLLKIASGPMMAHACRFPSGSDFSSSLRQMARQTGAHCIISIVGSLSSVTLRMPQHRTAERLPLLRLDNVPLEIVSATGTFARMGNDGANDGIHPHDADDDDPQNIINFHIHLSVSDSAGQVYGGHLIDGTVRTTAEVVLGSLQNVHFGREMDPATGFDELVVIEEK
jgi:uncharacterized protein